MTPFVERRCRWAPQSEPPHWALAVVACLGVATGLMGCRAVLGVDGYGTDLEPEDAALPEHFGTCDSVAYASLACRDCVDQRCCEVATACARDPACATLSQCLARCDSADHACRGLCNLSNARTSAMSALIECEARQCAACTAGRAPWGGGSCDACVWERCPDAMSAFSKEPKALELDACKKECPLSSAECPCDPYLDGAPEWEAVAACASGVCSAACDSGPDWSCLGSVKWPPLPASAMDLTLHVRLVKAESPLTPLLAPPIRACVETDVRCDSPLPLTTTWSGEGWTELSLGAPTNGRFFGHLLVPAEASELGADALLYFFPFVRRSPSFAVRRIVSQAIAEITAATVPDMALDWAAKGGVVWSATSCHGPATGMSVAIDSGERVYYLSADAVIDLNATETSTSSLGVIMNVTPGTRTLTASLPTTGQKVGTYVVRVLPGSITHLTLVPTP